jgi:hypothetical protein
MAKIEVEDVLKYCKSQILREEVERDKRDKRPFAASREQDARAAIDAYESVIRFLTGGNHV